MLILIVLLFFPGIGWTDADVRTRLCDPALEDEVLQRSVKLLHGLTETLSFPSLAPF